MRNTYINAKKFLMVSGGCRGRHSAHETHTHTEPHTHCVCVCVCFRASMV